MIFDVCYYLGTMSNFARLTLFWAPDTDPLPMNIYTEGIYSSTGDKGMSLKLNHIYWYVLLKNEGRKPIRDYIYLAVTPLHGIYGHGTTAASSGSISLDAWLPLLCQLLFWKRKHILGKNWSCKKHFVQTEKNDLGSGSIQRKKLPVPRNRVAKDWDGAGKKNTILHQQN